jgi:hypothetical protein
MAWMIAFTAALLIFPGAAHAYLDPGTGSFILQMLLAGGLAAGASIKLFWHRIKGVWLRLFPGPSQGVRDRK